MKPVNGEQTMYIMTAKGWHQLQPKNITWAPKDDVRYRGPLPSVQCLSFIRRTELAHEEWANRNMLANEPV
jgi:hypothetical protein